MALARFEGTLLDRMGNVIPNGRVQVQREAPGLPLASIFTDEDGTVPRSNPFQANANGEFFFYARGFLAGYRVRGFVPGVPAMERIFRHVRIGTAGGVDTDQLGIGADTDAQVDDLAGRAVHDAELEGYSVLVSDMGDGRAAIYSRVTSTPGVWSAPAIITGADGPPGTGLSADASVDTLPERDAYDGEPEGFTVAVSDVGDGRAAIYTMGPGGSGDWGAPAYLTGAQATITVGTVTSVASDQPATVTNSGTSADAIFDFEIPHGVAGTIEIGNVTTVPPGTPASATNVGTPDEAIIDFEIPQGYAATIAVGTVTTLAAGSPATVTNVGTEDAAVFNFGIPEGDPGVVTSVGAGTGIAVDATLPGAPVVAIAGAGAATDDTLLQKISGALTWAKLAFASIASAAIATVSELRAGTASKLVAAEIVKNSAAWVTLTYSGTPAPDHRDGVNRKMTLTGNPVIGAPTNGIPGFPLNFRLSQDGTGGRTATWDAAYDFGDAGAPVLSSGASQADLVTFMCDDGGTKFIFLGIRKRID